MKNNILGPRKCWNCSYTVTCTKPQNKSKNGSCKDHKFFMRVNKK